MSKTLWFIVNNLGDGDSSVSFFKTEEKAQAAFDHAYENDPEYLGCDSIDSINFEDVK